MSIEELKAREAELLKKQNELCDKRTAARKVYDAADDEYSRAWGEWVWVYALLRDAREKEAKGL